MNKIGLFLVLGLVSVTAQAHIQFEPFAGYVTGSHLEQDTSGNITHNDISGGYGGLRLAWMTPFRLWIGIEGETTFSAKGKNKDAPATADPNFDFTRTTGYVSIGYETMERIRLYGAYGVLDSLLQKETVATATGDTTYSGGTAFKVGLGYHLTQHIAINLEYGSHDYKKIKNNTYDNVDLKQTNIDSEKSSTYAVNFSLPFFW